MEFSEILPNIVALIGTFITMIVLSLVATKIGGVLGKMVKLLIVGIFFSVFLHSGFEVAGAYHMINEEALMRVMGGLLTIGSIFFIYAGLVGLKALK